MRLINDVKFSAYHKKAKIKKYKKNSNFRKPGNLMIQEVFKRWDINLSKSFMIGDKKSDYLSAKKSNLKFYYASNNFYKQINTYKLITWISPVGDTCAERHSSS